MDFRDGKFYHSTREFTSLSIVKISEQRDKLKWQLNGNEIGGEQSEIEELSSWNNERNDVNL